MVRVLRSRRGQGPRPPYGPNQGSTETQIVGSLHLCQHHDLWDAASCQPEQFRIFVQSRNVPDRDIKEVFSKSCKYLAKFNFEFFRSDERSIPC
jgi:hypothetical protein